MSWIRNGSTSSQNDTCLENKRTEIILSWSDVSWSYFPNVWSNQRSFFVAVDVPFCFRFCPMAKHFGIHFRNLGKLVLPWLDRHQSAVWVFRHAPLHCLTVYTPAPSPSGRGLCETESTRDPHWPALWTSPRTPLQAEVTSPKEHNVQMGKLHIIYGCSR